MSTWRWELTDDAAYDLEGIWDYVRSYSGDEGRAETLLDGLEKLFDTICRNPCAHAIYQFPEGYQPAHEYRSANHGRYKAFYRTDEKRKTMLIYRVRHVVSDFTRTRI